MSEVTEWKEGDRVEIGGRTMLRPGFSLVGLTGIIFPTAPHAPDGCLTVAIDWPGHGYNEESGYPDGSLPLFVNVPAIHLQEPGAMDDPKNKPKFQSKSQFKELSRNRGEESEPEPEPAPTPKPPKPDDEPEGGRPKLRLV